LSAFPVLVMDSDPLAFLTSHAQPEPKWDTAALLKLSLNATKLPNAASIASATSEGGSPPPDGLRLFQ
jgi:hypothetical protein